MTHDEITICVLGAALILVTVSSLFGNRAAYRNGVSDGAYNHGLPEPSEAAVEAGAKAMVVEDSYLPDDLDHDGVPFWLHERPLARAAVKAAYAVDFPAIAHPSGET